MLLDRGVINSGPMVALSLAGRLDLLPALFAEFWIPEQVFHEVVLAGVSRPGASALADARWALCAGRPMFVPRQRPTRC